MSELRVWLEKLGLGDFLGSFETERIELADLPDLTDTDLEKLGIPMGPRKRLIRAIADLESRPGPSAAAETNVEAKGLAPEAERRQLTVMFCDLIGSTDLSSRLDPEDLRDVMRAYQDACAETIATFGGHIAQTLGDGLMVYFGYPVAHEDDPQRAIRAGLGIVEALTSVDERMQATHGVPVAVRVGIHTGLVVAGELGGHDTRADMAIVGETPNIAARLQSIAKSNTVVVGERTRRLAGDVFDYEDLGPTDLRGVPDPMHLYRATAERAAESRFEATHRGGLTPFIGREEEIGLLSGRWAEAHDGDGQVVLLCGEPGIGKSRITGTFCHQIEAEDHTRIQYQCSPFFTNSAWHPVIRQLEHAAGFGAQDPNSVKLDKLETLLAPSTTDLAHDMPLFAALLSISTEDRYPALDMSPQRQKDLTIQALATHLASLGRQRPVLLVWEDAHWADPTSLEVLDHVINAASDLPVLVVITYRPEFVPPWSGYAHVTTHSLNRMGKRLSAALIGRVTDRKPLPDRLTEQIVTKTDGVPLFIEELTKAVIESDIVVDRGDSYELSGSVDAITIPDTLHDSLMARLDKLIPMKDIAQIGAAIGRQFTYPLIAALSPMSEPDLQIALDKLVSTELVYRRGTPPDAVYTFKHALVQDAAYDSLLKRDRQELHKQIAEVLLENFADLADTEPELIAHHYTAADDKTAALPYWIKAGYAGVQRTAMAEARAHFSKGMELVETLPVGKTRDEQELEIRVGLGTVAVLSLGWASDDAQVAFERARLLTEKVPEAAMVFPALHGVFTYYLVKGNQNEGHDVAKRMLDIAETANDTTLELIAHRCLTNILCWLGRFKDMRPHAKRVDELYDLDRHRDLVFAYNLDPKVETGVYMSHALWILGYPDQAMALAGETEQVARQLNHPFQLAQAIGWGGNCFLYAGKSAEMERRLTEFGALADRYDFGVWTALYDVWQSYLEIQRGDLGEAVERLRGGLEAWRATGSGALLHPDGMLAEALAARGERDDALAVVDRCLAQIEQWDEHFHEAELLRIKGLVYLSGDAPKPDLAERCFRDALAVARGQDARGWELRTATSLARLWQSQGKAEDARDLLAPVYDWFTEGFDTADLKAAKALLVELG